MTRPSTKQDLPVRDRIFHGVITVLANEGLGRLTHRRVAQAAGVSLAATTYHFRSKAEMVADASARLMADYIDDFDRLAESCSRGERSFASLDDLLFRLVANTASRHNARSLAWCEIILDATRSDEGQERARQWFNALYVSWRKLLSQFDGAVRDEAVISGIDTVIGMTLMVHGLGLDADAVARIWSGHADAPRAASAGEAESSTGTALTPKARRTRDAIIEATIDILMREGSGGVGFRTIALHTGMAQSAPSYYFESIGDLLREAEIALFQRSKARYRELSAERATRIASADELADLTMAIYTREATEHALASIAHYSIWLEAAREPGLRDTIARAIVDQASAWQRRLDAITPCGTFEGYRMQALFIGGIVRNVACGSNILEISRKRESFLAAIRNLEHLH